jgi:hypothetical protein
MIFTFTVIHNREYKVEQDPFFVVEDEQTNATQVSSDDILLGKRKDNNESLPSIGNRNKKTKKS